jgi:uncharacterized membrane protein
VVYFLKRFKSIIFKIVIKSFSMQKLFFVVVIIKVIKVVYRNEITPVLGQCGTVYFVLVWLHHIVLPNNKGECKICLSNIHLL